MKASVFRSYSATSNTLVPGSVGNRAAVKLYVPFLTEKNLTKPPPILASTTFSNCVPREGLMVVPGQLMTFRQQGMTSAVAPVGIKAISQTIPSVIKTCFLHKLEPAAQVVVSALTTCLLGLQRRNSNCPPTLAPLMVRIYMSRVVLPGMKPRGKEPTISESGLKILYMPVRLPSMRTGSRERQSRNAQDEPTFMLFYYIRQCFQFSMQISENRRIFASSARTSGDRRQQVYALSGWLAVAMKLLT